jgi:antagonist of KipI
MSLRIIKNGLLDTIQDNGRYGHQQLGINPGGAMDKTAMHIANALVGNDPAEAVIEMHFPAAEILFEETALIALAGAEFSATVNGDNIPLLHPVLIKKGSVLQFIKMQKGARVYLSVRGGFVADKWMDSYSTNLTIKTGGFKGRALQKNDQVILKQKYTYTFQHVNDLFEVFHWQAKISELYSENIFRFIAGAEYYLLNDRSKQRLESGTFTIKPESNRMGYRLRSETLQLQTKKEMISTAVTCGTIQLLPDGQLIVLMADHQTTGGYPRIGHIISADISSLAQMRPGEKFSLQEVTIHTAEKLLLDQQMNLQQLQNACTFRLQEYISI